jgi:hypothetical protein
MMPQFTPQGFRRSTGAAKFFAFSRVFPIDSGFIFQLFDFIEFLRMLIFEAVAAQRPCSRDCDGLMTRNPQRYPQILCANARMTSGEALVARPQGRERGMPRPRPASFAA